MAANPWSTVTGEVAPPPWQGESHVHRMPDDEEPKREPAEKREPPDPSLIARGQIAAHVEAGEMPKHPDCAQECQQAVDYGVWPERSCSPRCVWLSRAARDRDAGEMEAATHPQQEKQS